VHAHTHIHAYTYVSYFFVHTHTHTNVSCIFAYDIAVSAIEDTQLAQAAADHGGVAGVTHAHTHILEEHARVSAGAAVAGLRRALEPHTYTHTRTHSKAD
jgi:hypothetical protein